MLTQLLPWLLVATGFTGAFTLRFVWRMLCSMLITPPSVQVHLATGAGSLDSLRTALRQARREILVLARSFSARPIAQLLVDAKQRGVQVELLIDAACERDRGSDVPFFLDQGLPPQVSAAEVLGPEVLVLIDGRTLLTGGFASPPQEGDDSTVNLLELKGHPEVFQVYRQLVQDHRQDARPAQKPQPAPAFKPPPSPPERTQAAPPPQQPAASRPAPAPAPQPARSAPAPAPQPAERKVAAAATAKMPALASPLPAAPAPGSPAAATAAAAARLAAAPPPEPAAAASKADETPLPAGFDFAALRKTIQGAA